MKALLMCALIPLAIYVICVKLWFAFGFVLELVVTFVSRSIVLQSSSVILAPCISNTIPSPLKWLATVLEISWWNVSRSVDSRLVHLDVNILSVSCGFFLVSPGIRYWESSKNIGILKNCFSSSASFAYKI